MSYRRDPVPENTEDLRRYIDNEFRKIEDETDAIEAYMAQLTVAAYGGGQQVADIAFDIPEVTYITLPMDTLSPTVQRLVKIDLIADTITFLVEGVWRISVSFNIENITELNSSRTFEVRIYNETQAVSATPLAIPVSRNQGDIFFSTSFIVDGVVPGDIYRVELGGIDAIAGGDLIDAQIQANNLTELGELLNR